MSKTLNFENALIPVTALAFLKLERLYLVSGEGRYIKIFEHETGSLIARHRVFESENIHGIASCVSDHGGHQQHARLLLWGGHSLNLVKLSSQEPMIEASLSFNVALAEVRTEDWILDVCFDPFASETSDLISSPIEAIAVSAHGQLRSLRFLHEKSSEIQDNVTLEDSAIHRLGSQPNALLYSAHISWSREDYVEGRILVATGTVFGEVHLWSSKYDQAGKHGALRLHYTFTGHLGSVFGVQITEKVDVTIGSMTRLLASCSDDRTIRIWDISEMKTLDLAGETTRCLAKIMGHTSRIWAVHFLTGFGRALRLLSLGEDGTAQVWLLQLAAEQYSRNVSSTDSFELVHDTKYRYHFGKNVWAMAALENGDGTSLIATGGADGRIVSYQRELPELGAPGGTVCYQSTTDWVAKTCKVEATILEANMSKEVIFNAMQGQWRLSRTLQSALPTYPSGTLDGIANIQRRPATDPTFNEECVYSEEGNFITDKGFKMKATRQYAYRYQQDLNELTVWFVKNEGHGLVDYLFHRLETISKRKGSHDGKTVWTAKGHHICLNDEYTAEYRFTFSGQAMEEWRLKYIVKGTEKDYVADATYSRSSLGGEWAHLNMPPDDTSRANVTIQHGFTKIDAFKSYAWVSNTDFLTTTGLGNVLISTFDAHRSTDEADLSLPVLAWDLLGLVSDLMSSSFTTNVSSVGAVFIIGTNGRVFRYDSSSRTLKFVVAQQQKPVFLRAQEVQSRIIENGEDKYGDWGYLFEFAHALPNQSWISLVTASVASDKTVVSFHASNGHETSSTNHQFTIQLPKGFVVTSSCLLDKGTLVILGSRNGGLLVYDALRTSCKVGTSSSESVFAGIHGSEAITDIQILPERQPTSDPGTSWIVTTGRDGRFAVQRITFSHSKQRNRKPELETYHESALPFGPNIEGAHIDRISHDLLLWGFHSTQFVVWNETRKTGVMTVECGGAHRHWAYCPFDDGKGGGNFVWTKASVCNVHKQAVASHRVLQSGGHGREIKALAIAPNREKSDGSVRRVIATGAEDTAIRLFEYEPASGYRCIRIITNHTTGIQKLQWSGRHGQFLFSAAGCEEFFVWKILQVPSLGIGITSVLVCPNVTQDKDLRIMDFTVCDVHNSGPAAVEGISSVQLIAMIYSDSSVRIFVFRNDHDREYSLTLILEGSYTTHCLTQVVFAHLSSETYLCTASTDGHLAFWPLRKILADHGFYKSKGSSMLFEPKSGSLSPPKTFSWQTRFPVHQNSIKGLIHVQLSSKKSLIVTCGDDQALALISITAQEAVSTDQNLIHAVLLLPNAHTSAVTALAYLSSETNEAQTKHSFASVGNDQQLQIWEVIDKMHGEGIERFKMRKKMHMHTSVADASTLSVFAVSGDKAIELCLAGIGMETWSVANGLLTAHKE